MKLQVTLLINLQLLRSNTFNKIDFESDQLTIGSTHNHILLFQIPVHSQTSTHSLPFKT